jgi:4-hydroxybenzoate polyprenyltransferase
MEEKKHSRWFLGEPWGLLEKTNPRATSWTLLKNAVLGAVTGGALYGAVIFFRHEPTPHWLAKLCAWALGVAMIAALSEWQVGDLD